MLMDLSPMARSSVSIAFEASYESSHADRLLGFYGRSNDTSDGIGGFISRLGIIWGKSPSADSATTQGTPLGLSTTRSVSSDTHGPLVGLWEANRRWEKQGDATIRESFNFNPAYTEPPKLITGFAALVRLIVRSVMILTADYFTGHRFLYHVVCRSTYNHCY